MIDTSVIERKIHDQVMNMTFKAIVTEAFVGSLPIAESELTDGLTQGFVAYANECLEDLGSYKMLDKAIESAKDPVAKAYLKKMKMICMEAAQDVTARILKENTGNDKDLIEEAKAVSLTPDEYARFSKNAASVTPDSLMKMIQKKTLDVIKEEKEAYKKDAELETELKNALAEADDSEEDTAISTEPEENIADMQSPNGDKTGADIGQGGSDEPSEEPAADNQIPAGESFTSSKYAKYYNDVMSPSRVMESHFVDTQNAAKKDPEKNITGAMIGQACPCPIHQQKESEKDPVKKAAGHKAGKQVGQQGMHQEAVKGTTDPMKANEAFESYMKALAGDHNRPKHASVFSRLQELAYESMLYTLEQYEDVPFKTMADITKNNTFGVFGSKRNASMESMIDSIALYMPAQEGILDRFKDESRAVAKAMTDDDLIKAWLIAGEKRGIKFHTDMNELKEEMKASEETESNDPNPSSFDYKRLVNGIAGCINKDKTYGLYLCVIGDWKGKTKMFGPKRKEMEADVARYLHDEKKQAAKDAKKASKANESEATPDAPDQSAALSNSLLVASIIYTFFETLNTMNLYCPKLGEIKNFVDETLPVSQRVSLDTGAFKTFLEGVVSNASSQLRKADTTQDVDAMQKNLDMVREKCNAPGFEAMRAQINTAVESIQKMIDQKKDQILEAQKPKQVAVESYTDTLKRTRDVQKFDKAAFLLGRKPNVTKIRCKVDPQMNSKYIAVEAFDARNEIAGKTTIVLESALMGNLVDQVINAINSSKLAPLGKQVVVSDARSGKIYLDTSKK